MSLDRWEKVSESQFAWEREALEYIRTGLPDHDPYRAWANFEFIADDGSINEVDLLVVTPMGFFMVEIKSRPGKLRGDPGTWTWVTTKPNGKTRTIVEDNPLLLCNRKAKKFASMLKRQSAFNKHRCPFLEAIVFCSADNLEVTLYGNGRHRIALRDSDDDSASTGIISALKRRELQGLKQDVPGVNKPQAKAIARALEQIGIRPSQSARRVGDYVLTGLLYESSRDCYQDFTAKHTSKDVKDAFRVRIYNASSGSPEEEKEYINRAARREYEICQELNHDAIVQVQTITDHELGPALVFRHDPEAIRFDHYLHQRADTLSIEHKLSLIRQLAEAVKYAHGKHIIHRALSPQSIMVREENDEPLLKIFNWMAGHQDHATESTTQTCTLHPDQLVDDESMVYLCPEAVYEPASHGRHFDVFSLGAITYHIMSGKPPATSFHELNTKMEAQGGLEIRDACDTAPEELRELIHFCTAQNYQNRYDSVDEFTVQLDEYVNQLTQPDNEYTGNPLDAKPGDRLKGGYEIKRRLGKGSTAVVLLVEKNGREQVLKLANKVSNNNRIETEYKCLKKLKHELIVEAYDLIMIDGLRGFTMKQAGKNTLAEEIHQIGRLQLELLERYGNDLLDLVDVLEKVGVAHRDIKPDNIGIGSVTAKGAYRLQLFDFSLTGVSLENIMAGTPPYRDPFLPRPERGRWDNAAERFSVAMTLYEMATGSTAIWEGGHRSGNEVTIDAESLESSVRQPLTDFFTKALRNDARQRFDNAELMRSAWRDVFRGIDSESATVTTTSTSHTELGGATLDSDLVTLGISPLAASAFEKLNLLTARDLLKTSIYKVRQIRGTGLRTQKEIMALYDDLKNHFPDIESTVDPQVDAAIGTETVDMLVSELERIGASKKEKLDLLHRLFGLKETGTLCFWPGVHDLSQQQGVNEEELREHLRSAQQSLRNVPAFTALRKMIAELLDQNGIMAVEDLASAVLSARGSVLQDEKRRDHATAVVRAAVEAERSLEVPAFVDLRLSDRVFIAVGPEFAAYVQALGKVADELAQMDPLASGAQAVEALRAVTLPDGVRAIPKDGNLLRLACRASDNAAASGRLEVYPRQMDALRALTLAQGTICGVPQLTEKEINSRVCGRYPEAQPLPSRPTLDEWLRKLGLELTYDEAAGAFVYPRGDTLTLTSSGSSVMSFHSESPEVLDARRFHKRLEDAAAQGGYLVLTCDPKRLQEAHGKLVTLFDLELVDVDQVFIETIRRAKETQEIPSWQIVLEADAADRASEDWQIFQELIREHCMPQLEAALSNFPKTALLVNSGLLARYDQIGLIGRLRDKALKRNGLRGLWMLVPAHGQNPWPLLNGEAIPVLGTSQYEEIPAAWLAEEFTDQPLTGSPT